MAITGFGAAIRNYSDDPLVDLGGNGPSTLSPTPPQREVEFLGSLAPLAITDVAPSVPGRPTGAGLPGPTRQRAFMESLEPSLVTEEAERQGLLGAQPSGVPMGGGDIDALLAALAGQQSGVDPFAAAQERFAGQMERFDASAAGLADLVAGVQDDSRTLFGRLQGEAGSRGRATSSAISDLTGDTDQRLAGVGAAVGGDPAGGLGGGRLSQGATEGSSGVREVQAALGGFLSGSAQRRGQATADYLSGLEGLSQIAVDRARTTGEFMLAQQRAVMEQEQQRVLNDIAAQTASEQAAASILGAFGLPSIPGLTPAQALDFAGEARQRTRMEADIMAQLGQAPGGGPAPREPGPFGQDFLKAGISESVIEPLERVEMGAEDWVASLDEELRFQYVDNDGNFTPEGVRAFADDNFLVVSPNDPRYGQLVDLGDGRRRVALTSDDWRKYLQWGLG